MPPHGKLGRCWVFHHNGAICIGYKRVLEFPQRADAFSLWITRLVFPPSEAALGGGRIGKGLCSNAL